MSQLLVEHVAKEYATRSEPLCVLRDVTFSLSAGENLAILGPSGSGKSTLLHILGALDRPTSGRVLLAGEDPGGLDEAGLARFRGERVGFVFQEHHLLPQCSVLENVLLPCLAVGGADRAAVDWARALLDRVGLSARLDHRPAELSGGERQRVAIARALIRRPQLLLADEPTGNLDRATANTVTDLLLELPRQEGAMLVVVTHSHDLAARMQRRTELNAGRLEAA